MDYSDFQNIYDFTLFEKAVQSVFVATQDFVAPANDDDPNRESWTPGGLIPFYTAFQNLTFQKCRPRVYFSSFQFKSVPGCYAIDGNGNFREKAWDGTARLGVVTAPKYDLHTQLRAKVLSVIPQVMFQLVTDSLVSETMEFNSATGANQFLDYHELSQFTVTDLTTTITPQDDVYLSMIPINLSFSVKQTAWPQGMITT